ncbi:MAG: HAD-IIB family hydrolase [Halobaculum sp.]
MAEALPPLALDIDGTLTDGDGAVDPRIFRVLPDWPAPVVLATGKAFPYPVALCHFLGMPMTVIAENGGVTLAEDTIQYEGDPERVRQAVDAFRERGGNLGWEDADTVNRWRETEVAARLTADENLLAEVADEFGLELLDTGYAYHLKSPDATKGRALERLCGILDLDPGSFLAIGDSENDVSTFAVAGQSYAVANADDAAREAADEVLDEGYAEGTLSLLETIRTAADGDRE